MVGLFMMRIIRDLTGGIGIALVAIVKVIAKTIDGTVKFGYDVCHFFNGCAHSHVPHVEHSMHLNTFRAMAALKSKHGCRDISDWWQDMIYWIQRAVGDGGGLCKDLEWFQTITMTRYLVYYPLKWAFWVSMHGDCNPTVGSDICAVAGLEYVFEFFLYKGILAIVIVTRCWPLIRAVLKSVASELSVICFEFRYIFYKLNPKKIAHKHSSVNWCQRRQHLLSKR